LLIIGAIVVEERGKGRAPGHHMLTERGVQAVAQLKGVGRSELKWAPRSGGVDQVQAHQLDVQHHQPVDAPERRVLVREAEPLEHVSQVLAQPFDALDVAVDGRLLLAARLEGRGELVG
jgi:hypothetical protein